MLYTKLIAERRQTLIDKAQEALQETERLRMMLAICRHQSADKARAEQTLKSWSWDGLKARMSGCAFSPYVGTSPQSEISLPVALEQAFDRNNTLGLGTEFIQALIAKATLDGVAALARFYRILDANALHIPVARRAFTAWAAYQVLAFEHTTYRSTDKEYWTPPGAAREMIPTLYQYTFQPRHVWDVIVRSWVFDPTWWPSYCPEPFWAASFPRDAIPMMQARFEPERIKGIRAL